MGYDLMEPVLDGVVWLLRTVTSSSGMSSKTSEAPGGLVRRRPANWARFIQQLLDCPALHRDAAFVDARAHLQRSFGILGEMVSAEGTAQQWPFDAASFWAGVTLGLAVDAGEGVEVALVGVGEGVEVFLGWLGCGCGPCGP